MANGIVTVKCMLHISFDEQRRRFLRRLRRDDTRRKSSESDLDTRRHWNGYQAAYPQPDLSLDDLRHRLEPPN